MVTMLDDAEAAYRRAYLAAAGPNRSGNGRGRVPQRSLGAVLIALEAHPGTWAYELASVLGIEAHGVGKMLRNLRRLGLATASREDVDRYVRRPARTHWRLTVRGAELAALARAAGMGR
jgi:predicted ArsR family transcriptional regulator